MHKKTIYLDGDAVEANEIEAEANRISGDILIPPANYKAFLAKNRFYQSDILEFARKIKIHPGIVVGRLQHDGYLTNQTTLNSLKIKYVIG